MLPANIKSGHLRAATAKIIMRPIFRRRKILYRLNFLARETFITINSTPITHLSDPSHFREGPVQP